MPKVGKSNFSYKRPKMGGGYNKKKKKKKTR